MKIRVFRLLVYEGEREWINHTLNSGIVDEYVCSNGKIVSMAFRENDVILQEEEE